MWFLLTDAEGNRLGFSLGIGFRREQRSVEISSHAEQTRPLHPQCVAVHLLVLVRRGP